MFDYEKIEKLTAIALESIETKDADAIKEAYKALDDAFLAEFPGKPMLIAVKHCMPG